MLDEVLRGEKLHRLERVVAQPVLPSMVDILPQFDMFLAEIEMQMEKLYELLCEKVKGAGIIEFLTLKRGCSYRSGSHVYSAVVSGAGWKGAFVAE